MSDDLSGDKLAPSWPNLVIDPTGLQCKTNLEEIMGLESSDVDRFGLGPLIHAQTMVHFGELSFHAVDTYLHRFSNASG